MARRLVVALAVALLPLVASGCRMFRLDTVPADVETAFNDSPRAVCTIITERAERKATATTTDGARYELWVAPTLAGDESATIVVDEDVHVGGFSMGASCGLPDRDDDVIATFGGGIGLPGGGVRQFWGGRAPRGTTEVHADFGSNRVVVAEVKRDGYFLVVHSTPPEVMGGNGWFGRRALFFGAAVTALDEAGNVLASG